MPCSLLSWLGRNALATFCRVAILAVSLGHPFVSRGEAPTVETTGATPLGNSGVTLNGIVHPHGVPTSYWFEFGPTTQYGQSTERRDVPPALAAFYREEWHSGTCGWAGGMSGTDLAHHPDGGAPGGFVRFSEPSGLDPNHIDGIGWLHLASYFYPGWHLNSAGASAFLAVGSPDLRDARVSLSVRGNDWHSHGAELIWWSQTQSNDEASDDPRRPNWAYTGFSLNEALRSGKWEHVEYRLLNDSRKWTYAGNNAAQNRAMYEYGSIDAAQRDMDIDFFHLLAFVNPDQPPTGSIDFDNFEIAYRNYSLLLPGNGGQLRAQPPSAESADRLTDGWRNGTERMWRSAPHPQGPLEFVWDLARPVTVTAVQIHQHTQWPSREVEVAVSPDGQSWEVVEIEPLPEQSSQGANLAFVLRRHLSLPARALRVRILSGYRAEHWGLGEIEVFGTGAILRPGDEPFHVNLDLTARTPGETIHYRLVALNEHGRAEGADQTFVVPSQSTPHTVLEPAARIRTTSAQLVGRVCPMGYDTESYFEYGAESKFDRKSPPIDCGQQITPRSVLFTVNDLEPGTTYQYRLVAENERGRSVSEPAVFTTPETDE